MKAMTAMKEKSLSVTTENFKFGLSVLHAKIRFFECLLHIGYRLELKTWKVSFTLKIGLKIINLQTLFFKNYRYVKLINPQWIYEK